MWTTGTPITGSKCIKSKKYTNIQTMEYYLALERNELSGHKKTWKNLMCIMLSGRSQSEKATDCVVPTIGHSGKGKTTDNKKVSSCGGGGGLDRWSRGVFLAQGTYSV